MLPRPYARRLSDPVRVFDFDFRTADAALARRKELSIPCARDGVLNAFVIYFDLDLDDVEHITSGPDAPSSSAWDQLVRYLPVL